MIHEPAAALQRGPVTRGSRLGLAGVYTLAVLVAMGLSDALVSLGSDVLVSLVGTEFSLNAGVTVLSVLACWTIVLQTRSLPRVAVRSVVPLLAFVVWVVCEALLNGNVDEASQFVLVQTGFAGTIVVAGIAQYRSRLGLNRLAGRAVRVATVVLLLAIAFTTGGVDVGMGPRAMAMVALVCASWFLAERLCGRLTSTGWALALVVAIGLSLSRTALFAAFVLVLVAAGSLSSRHRVRSLVAIALLGISGYWLVNHWAPLRDRFVTGDVSLSVAGISVNASGRTEVWNAIWDEWKSEPLVGHGPGAASELATRLNPGLGHPHNDYLRLLGDLGLIGLGLWVWFAIRVTRLLRRARARPQGALPARAALLAGLSVLILMVTDNPVDYSFVMLPLGVLIGLALGARSRSVSDSVSSATDRPHASPRLER